MANDTQSGMPITALPFNETCYHIRDNLKQWTRIVMDVRKGHPIFKSLSDGIRDDSEMIANLMLAYRHLEDATMRIGKAVQAFDGGKSVYPR